MVSSFPLRQPSEPIEAMRAGQSLEASLRQWHQTFSDQELHQHISALTHSCALVAMPLNELRITLMREELYRRFAFQLGY